MNDAIDLSSVIVADAPDDVASWQVTVGITELKMGPNGLSFTTTPELPSSWNYRIPGWDGDVQYTVWPVAKVNGQWFTSGIIQMWQGRPSTGAPILSDFHQNWAYATRWGGLYDYQPQVGDQMGFFLTAGNARDERGVTSKRERSNVVAIHLPANDTGVFTFPLGVPPSVPPPVTLPPSVDPDMDLTPILSKLAQLNAAMESQAEALTRQLDTMHQLSEDLAALKTQRAFPVYSGRLGMNIRLVPEKQ